MSIPSESHLIRALLDISRKMVETRALDPLLHYAVKLCMEQFGAEYGYLILLKPDGSLDYRVQIDANGSQINDPDDQISHTIFQEAIKSGEPVLTISAIDDPKFHRAASVVAMKLRSVLCVPLVSRGQSLGVLYLENRTFEKVFTRDHIEPLAYFASQAAAIIENAILNEQMESLIVARTHELYEANAQLRHEMEERARIENQLIEVALERERGQILRQFVQSASHEFRTPLSIIQVSVALIRSKYAQLEKDHHLQQIQDQVKVMVELIENMVLTVQLEGANPERIFNKMNLAHVVQSRETSWSKQCAERHHTLTIDLEENLPEIDGDIGLMCQALDHLVKNAVQYTPEYGKIEICIRHGTAQSTAPRTERGTVRGTERGGKTLEIVVSDSGPGISQDEHEAVFRRFYRGDKAGTTRGFGLGLSIAQLITSLHGGTLSLEKTDQRGSRFIMSLPVFG